MSNTLLTSITKLDGSNYYEWIFDIEMLARRLGTWAIVTGDETMPVKTDGLAEWTKKSVDALTMIGLTVAKSELVHIRGCKDAHEMWKALASVYAKSSRANRISLRQQLNATVLGSDGTVREYVSRVSDIASQLRAVGVKLEDEDEVDVLIMNLPESWGHVASSLMIRPGDLKVSEVVGVLLEEETRRRHTDTQAAGLAAYAAKGVGARKAAGSGVGNGEGRASSSDYRSCYRCGERGHIVANCPVRPVASPASSAPRAKEHANLAYRVSGVDLGDEFGGVMEL
jgi:hypothetical protein